MTKSEISALSIATWMVDELKRDREIHQESIVSDIIDRFGEQFTYSNSSGNLAINKDVLNAFNKLTGSAVVWERSRRVWRYREQGDEEGRMQP